MRFVKHARLALKRLDAVFHIKELTITPQLTVCLHARLPFTTTN
jgi:hypothetical protein